MSGRKRMVQIKFRVTEEERTLIEEKMKQIPTSALPHMTQTPVASNHPQICTAKPPIFYPKITQF